MMMMMMMTRQKSGNLPRQTGNQWLSEGGPPRAAVRRGRQKRAW